jgi:phosphatidyl-myo-inositol dimannoside synthase
MKILYLATDAYGGWGGIAQYNRDLIDAMCGDPLVRRVVASIRSLRSENPDIPEKLEYHTTGTSSRLRFALDAIRTAFKNRDADFVYCAHINLAPVVWLIAKLLRKPWVLAIYGIDAWEGRASFARRFFCSRADIVVSISNVTLQRFLSWCPVPAGRTTLLPNAVHLERYGMAPKSEALLRRYGLENRRVIMTLGRLDSYERFKGFDAVLDVLPELAKADPDLCYVIAGDGRDRARLAEKAEALGVSAHVLFTGVVREDEKADHYRLADAFVLASKGEGFGFVLLEAMACGVPVVASSEDGGREAVREGALGQVVDPDDPAALAASIRKALAMPKHVPAGLEYFDTVRFYERARTTLSSVGPRWRELKSSPAKQAV